jgi:carbonic anhydrase
MPLRKLASGFLTFRAETFLPKRAVFEALARKQEPKVMMIACSDSRVDPAILTNAEPGDIFMVRNVANLVPPFVGDDSPHGTSAALEFAVTALAVQHIIVLGHAGCGGIRALLTADPVVSAPRSFIKNWMSIGDEARRRMLLTHRHCNAAEQQRALELEAIKTSLANLLTFPWVVSRLAEGTLRIHGWYFDINDGEMYVYVPDEDRFRPLTIDIVSELQEA